MVLLDKKINFQALDNLEEIKNKWIEVFAGHLTERYITNNLMQIKQIAIS